MMAIPFLSHRCGARTMVLAGMITLSGCAGAAYEIKPGGERVALPERTLEEKAEASATVAEAMHGLVAPYRLRAGDSVVVSYTRDPTPMEDPYRLQPGDLVRVTGVDPTDPARADRIRVMPDGSLSLPEVQTVDVAGRSMPAARAALAARFAEVLRAPDIGLALEQGTLEADLFLQDIGNGLGADMTLTVMPDGTVVAPGVGALSAMDLTLGELAARLDDAYAKEGLSLLTQVSLASGSGLRTFVMGEVKTPGMLTTDRPLTVLMAVSMAGGPTTSAKTEGTRVIYLTKDGEPRMRRLDLDRVRDQALLEDDLILPGDAVIYVPPSALTMANRYADQVMGEIGFFRGFLGVFGGLDLASTL
ncbi:MAG: polysaccharide biosynthesis/export family protein [Rhodospirillum sp.]|nr:polysaccharide biosynthesis/export family protein [Rhodospirillum sp.]MCF8489998.1 polysaccharide biosynthesis/export family protein [Rhodospirillum sp.]